METGIQELDMPFYYINRVTNSYLLGGVRMIFTLMGNLIVEVLGSTWSSYIHLEKNVNMLSA